jgi:hypothetical protein
MVQRNLVLIPLCCGGSELKRSRCLGAGLGWFGCWGGSELKGMPLAAGRWVVCLLCVARVCVLVGWFLLAVTGVLPELCAFCGPLRLLICRYIGHATGHL